MLPAEKCHLKEVKCLALLRNLREEQYFTFLIFPETKGFSAFSETQTQFIRYLICSLYI